MSKINSTQIAAEPKMQEADVKPIPAGKYDALPTTSAKIRAMHQDGMSKGAIAKALGKRFQHVRNVLVTPVKNPKV